MANLKKNKRRKTLIFIVILLSLAGLGIFAYLRKPERVITVQTEKIAQRSLTELVMATGKIQPVVFVKISPEVSGEIIELPVKEGQSVSKGDILFRIKPDFYAANRNSAEASLNSALANNEIRKAQLTKAEAELHRYEELYKNSLISDSQFLEVKTAFDIEKSSLEQSAHQVAMSRASLARAEEELSKTTVYAPLTGIITKLNSQLGERVVGTATYQGTEVMTISDLNDMEARVDIGEIDVVLIKQGQKARLEVDAYRDKKFDGQVSEIANSAKSSGSGQQEATKFEVRIRILEKEAFRPGMSVTAEVETRYRTNVLAVPIQSVTTRLPKESKTASVTAPATSTNQAPVAAATNVPATNSSPAPTVTNSALDTNASRKPHEPPKPVEVVFLVDNGQAKMVKVTRGISDDTHVEITEGVTEGQEVVSGGYKEINRQLEDGVKVRVDNTKKDWSQKKAPDD